MVMQTHEGNSFLIKFIYIKDVLVRCQQLSQFLLSKFCSVNLKKQLIQCILCFYALLQSCEEFSTEGQYITLESNHLKKV